MQKYCNNCNIIFGSTAVRCPSCQSLLADYKVMYEDEPERITQSENSDCNNKTSNQPALSDAENKEYENKLSSCTWRGVIAIFISLVVSWLFGAVFAALGVVRYKDCLKFAPRGTKQQANTARGGLICAIIAFSVSAVMLGLWLYFSITGRIDLSPLSEKWGHLLFNPTYHIKW